MRPSNWQKTWIRLALQSRSRFENQRARGQRNGRFAAGENFQARISREPGSQESWDWVNGAESYWRAIGLKGLKFGDFFTKLARETIHFLLRETSGTKSVCNLFVR